MISLLLFSVNCALNQQQTPIKSLLLNVKFNRSSVWSTELKFGDKTNFNLHENQTLSIVLKTSLLTAPKHHVCTLEHGPYSISSPFSFQNGDLTLSFSPIKLGKLYKHSEIYDFSILIADDSIKTKPVGVAAWQIGKVNFTANNEVFDNFTDVEWDFQPPHVTPKATITQGFNIIVCLPFGVLLLLLLVNGINCGYFPHNFIDAIFSLAFVACLGAFFAYFIKFWKEIHFEDMIKSLIPIFLVLGILLRRALIGRAKMVVRHSKAE